MIISSKRFELEAGTYAYVGSARGAGGVEKRVERHFSLFRGAPRKVHWHIDHLLPIASSLIAIALEGDRATECSIASVLKEGGFAAVEGFGSTDCRSECGGHLLRSPHGPAPIGRDGHSEEPALVSAREAIRKLGVGWIEMRPLKKIRPRP